MNNGSRRILLIGAEDAVAVQIQKLLEANEGSTLHREASFKSGMNALEHGVHDVVICTLVDGDKKWSEGISAVSKGFPATPIIAVVSAGTDHEEIYRCGVLDVIENDDFMPRAMGMSLRHAFRIVEIDLERRYRQLLDAQNVAHMGSWDMDTDGNFVWSEGFSRVLGCAPEDITSLDSLRTFIHPEDRDVFDQANRATFQDGWPVDFEYRIIRPDGELRYLHLHRRVELDAAGKVVRAYGIARDITPQKHFETALSQRDGLLQATGLAAGRFLRGQGWEEEADSVIQALGRAMGAGVTFLCRNEVVNGELVATVIHDWCNPEHGVVPKVEEGKTYPYSDGYARWQERMTAKKPIMGVTRNLPRSERKLLERFGLKSILVLPLFVDEEWWGIMGMAESRAEREWMPAELESLQLAAEILGSAIHRDRMERKLRIANLSASEAQKEAEEANKAKSLFLANMSHEIRTPISGIIGLTEMTITTGIKPEQRKNLNMIRDAARSLLNIINDILDISKIEAHKLALSPADFNLRTAMDRTVKPFIPQARQKGLDMDMHIESDVPDFVHGDEDRLAQIIRNLLSNAIKFTDKGHVDVHVELDKKEEKRVSLLFRVTDTGVGIPAGMEERIFENFMQVDSSAHKKHQGTGLGLAITKELVVMMGGEIEVRSRERKGSVFSFRVWFQDARSAPAPEENLDQGLPVTLNLNILLAEDNPLNQKFLTHFLTMFGHTVSVAGNGQEVIDVLKREKGAFDLVLMDIQMPRMGGIEATEIIRASDGRLYDKDIPVIALTAYAMKGDRDRMLGAGMDDYVSKPVDMEELSTVISRTVNRRRQAIARRTAAITPRSPLVRPAQSRAPGFKLNIEALSDRFRGNNELLVEILDIFLQEANEKMEQLNDAWSQQDSTRLAATLHSVSNIVSHVHALELMSESRQLERWVSDGRMDLVGSGFPGLKQRFRQVIEAVRAFRKEFDGI